MTITPTLRPGDTGERVRALQDRLTALGYYTARIDGDFGPLTRAGVEAFQAARSLSIDGIVGPMTAGRLNSGSSTAAPAAPPVPKPAATPAGGVTFNQPKATRDINEIIVHCTATPEGREVSVDTIRSWHKGQGWRDIGYHWVVLLDGTIRPGRPEAQIGSHVASRNTGTIGVVYVGGVARDGRTPKDTRTPAQRAALLALCRALKARYPTIRKISGHNQYSAKACPSFDVRKDVLGRLV